MVRNHGRHLLSQPLPAGHTPRRQELLITDDRRGDEPEPAQDGDALIAELIALSHEVLAPEVVGEPGGDGRPVCWDDVLPIADRVLPVWVDGAELAWGEHAWTALTEAGLTEAWTEVDRARVVCRLLALALLYREFCVRAFEEGVAGDWSPDVGDVLGDEEPYLHPFVLGQLAERDGIDADVEVGYAFEEGTPAYALREVARDQYGTVVSALRGRWGSATLFASLWMSTDADTTYPLAREVVGDVVNRDVSFSKLAAWQWVEEGMHLG